MKNKTIKVLTSLGIVVFMLLLVGWWNFEYKESIKQLIRQIEHKLAPPPGQSKLYVAYLSFQNPEIQSAMHRSVTAELINKLIAIRVAIKGLGGSLFKYLYSNHKIIIKDSTANDFNFTSGQDILVEIPYDTNYKTEWTLEEKIKYSLKSLKEADIDEISDFIIERESNLKRQTLRNSVSNRTYLMNKDKLIKSKLKKQKGRKEKHIYSLI